MWEVPNKQKQDNTLSVLEFGYFMHPIYNLKRLGYFYPKSGSRSRTYNKPK